MSELGRFVGRRGCVYPDALIAGTAIEHKLSLFSRNTSDFEKVSGLRLRDIG